MKPHFAIRRTIIALLGAISFACAATAVRADSTNGPLILNSGTIIPAFLNTELTSNNSQVGDTFSASVDDSKAGYRHLHGATLSGFVRAATPQSGKDPGTLDLTFTTLKLADGRSISIAGAPTSLDPSKVAVNSNGVLQAKDTNKDNRGTYAGIGAGAGALISLIGNGKLKLEDILLGGLAGFGAATVIKGDVQVHDVDLKPGTSLGVLLGSSVDLTPPQAASFGDSAPKYHQSGVKYYSYMGQTYAMDLATGERYPVTNPQQPTAPATMRTGFKYYSYMGHPYRLDQTTGERIRLD
jgi:hypothetical protein